MFNPVSYVKRYAKTKARKALLAYLVLVLPSNYVTMATLTPTSWQHPTHVLSAVTQSGVINILTGGLFKPMSAFGSKTIGAGVQYIGDTIGDNDISAKGVALITQGEQWFNGRALHAPKVERLQDGTQSRIIAQQANDYYDVLGVGTASFSTICPTSPSIVYTGRVDSEGRIGAVCGLISHDMYMKSKGTREEMPPSLAPLGWGNNEKVSIPLHEGYQQSEYYGWFWNRSHLIADSLGGQPTYDNMITGTRMQNVGGGKGGMAYTERKARAFFEQRSDCAIKYEATPEYTSNELIPRSVLVNIQSCDNTINEQVRVYNDAQGYVINYVNGTFSAE